MVFGERVVLMDGAAGALPVRVYFPGPGTTVADQVERAIDPVAEKRRSTAAAALGVRLRSQCEVDIIAADRLCPPTDSECRRAQAVLDLGVWRYRLDHCPPGPRLAALLEERPNDAAPAPGAGTVVGGTITLPGRRPGAPGGSNGGDDAPSGDAAPSVEGSPSGGDRQGVGDVPGSDTPPRVDGARSRDDDLGIPAGPGVAMSARDDVDRSDVVGGTDDAVRTLRVISTDPDHAPAPLDSDVWPRTVLATIAARQRLISHLQARQYADIAGLSASYRNIEQFLTTELGLALTLTDSDAAGLLATAEALRNRLPGTAAALAEGRIDDAKAIAMVRATANCTPEVAEQVEKSVLPDAERITSTAVRRRAGRAVIAADPDGAADRHRRAVNERHVWRAPDDDGMARLGIYAAAQDIDTIWRAITAVADAIKRPGDTRSLGERRADAMTMICSDILGAGGWEALRLPDKGLARPRVNVTVPFTVLLGHRAPCDLAGHGSISTEQALALIGGGDLYRMICDPESGMLLDYGHTRYRPPPHLAEFVRRRDGECPLPTCHHPAERGQIDHIVPAKPDPVTGKPTLGTTSAENLGPPCPHHHLGKDAGRGFTLHRNKDGTYIWVTPLGLIYSWRPDPLWHEDTDAIPGSVLHEMLALAGGTVDGCGEPGESDVAVCDCPDTCPCQQSLPAGGSDGLVPLVIDADWADGFVTDATTPGPATPDADEGSIENPTRDDNTRAPADPAGGPIENRTRDDNTGVPADPAAGSGSLPRGTFVPVRPGALGAATVAYGASVSVRPGAPGATVVAENAAERILVTDDASDPADDPPPF